MTTTTERTIILQHDGRDQIDISVRSSCFSVFESLVLSGVWASLRDSESKVLIVLFALADRSTFIVEADTQETIQRAGVSRASFFRAMRSLRERGLVRTWDDAQDGRLSVRLLDPNQVPKRTGPPRVRTKPVSLVRPSSLTGDTAPVSPVRLPGPSSPPHTPPLTPRSVVGDDDLIREGERELGLPRDFVDGLLARNKAEAVRTAIRNAVWQKTHGGFRAGPRQFVISQIKYGPTLFQEVEEQDRARERAEAKARLHALVADHASAAQAEAINRRFASVDDVFRRGALVPSDLDTMSADEVLDRLLTQAGE